MQHFVDAANFYSVVFRTTGDERGNFTLLVRICALARSRPPGAFKSHDFSIKGNLRDFSLNPVTLIRKNQIE
ncbi:MAG: hypothetical protein ABSF83_03865 [Nitrososphaerales archaeon]